jgi:3-hydroxymyristoyl/3-hydroxydecanoyl-(acyl carrier protein) dehydratase
MLYPDALTLDPMTLTSVRRSDLLDRICVRPPYFALEHLGYHDQVFTALATSRAGQHPEYGPMPGAEISRHAAIAGLCAAALSQPDDQRRYYLAQEARYIGTLNRAPAGTPVRLTAELLTLDKRQARAAITAEAGGDALARVEVLYTVLTDSAFSRLFRSRHQPQFVSAHIDRLPGLPPGIIQRLGNKLVREIEQIPAEACAGHFEGYPAMPVAILMGQLAQLAGEAFGGRFHIREASVQASDFCWAGEAARFEVTPERVTALHTTYACAAYANDRTIGQMQLVLEHKV